MKIFISGSRGITQLNSAVTDELLAALRAGDEILVGSAVGVDEEVQKFCREQGYEKLTVFTVDKESHGNSDAPHSLFIQNDITMANSADRGLVIWDGESKGSFNNMVRLVEQNKPCRVYCSPKNVWVAVENESDIETLKPQADNERSLI